LTRGGLFAGRYEIIEELGKGGMGKVYKAVDTKINEKIALKLIKSEIASDKKSLERFGNELKLARKITHKNVGKMFDINEEAGTHYITMEYVSGQDLKALMKQTGQLTIGTSISISKQICEGLTEAHKLGVVHRDLKPNNVMIDEEGQVRIMDFGIARSLKDKGITAAGIMIGTPEYMSPEQAEATEVDQRSDIYSLGVILYEMLTGRLPFEGETPLSVAMKHKGVTPEEPIQYNTQISDDLNRVILRCLEKEKDKRYQNAKDVSSELENIEKGVPATKEKVPKRKSKTTQGISSIFGWKNLLLPAAIILVIVAIGVIVWQLLLQKESLPLLSGKPSIAVLPFEDMSPQKDQEYLCDGMTDEIIAKLSALEGWKVISRTSVLRLKEKDIDIKEIGQDLDVATVLEGTVRMEGDNIRVTARLVNVEDRFQVWSDTYNQKLENYFEIQSIIAEKIAEALETKISSEEGARLKKKPTDSLQAHSFYLQGRWFLSQRTKESLAKAIEYFEKALEEDPGYAMAYAGLADTYAVIPFFSPVPPKDAYGKAKEAVLKSLEIDNTIAETYTSLAAIKEQMEFDWEGAYEDHQKALKLNPGLATAHHWFAIHLICKERHDEALSEIRKAHELDPLSFIINNYEGDILYWSRRYNQAMGQFEKTLDLFPNNAEAHSRLGMVYLELGKYEDAFVELKKSITLAEGLLDYIARLGYAYAVCGRRDDALMIVNDLKEQIPQTYVSPYLIAAIYSALNETDFAFQWLDKAYETRDVYLIFLKVDPIFQKSRSDQRFMAMLKKINLD
jgi:serine/threonine-protein kinase